MDGTLLLEEEKEAAGASGAGNCCCSLRIVGMVGSWSREMESEMDSRNVISWRRRIDDGGCRMMVRVVFFFCLEGG